jgi:hypothetical protein
MSYRWIITKDHIDDGNAVGTEGPGNCDPDLKSNPQRFSLYDDDKECYAEGMLYSTDESYNGEALLGPLDDFGMPNWGCVLIKVDGEWIN